MHPNAPKRPPSSYILFQNEVRKELKAKYPDLPPPELVQMISKRWAAMSEDEKAPYNAITTAAKAAWVDKKGAYDAEHAGDAPIVAPPPRKRAPKAVAPKAAAKPVSKAAAAPKPVEPSTEDDDEEDEEEDEDDEEEEAPAKSAAKSAAASTSSGSEEEDSEEEQEEVVPPPKKKTAGRQPAPKAKEKKSKA
ncbi:HMG-box [Athelia psychrophila]|uniref:HMG-box n=1 Tax=Athelia psychrophila TaxID=1759441 RepID=A0A166KBV6_9AGAM|nr:HMG-box [Fibularhizoctonia sp. CBS 109695]